MPPADLDARLHRFERALPSWAFEALRTSEAQVPARPPDRAAIKRELERRGAPTTDPVLDFLALMDGVTLRWLQVSLARTRSLCRRLPAQTLSLAVPIGTGPSDANFWIDAQGIVYDDTDLERCVPVGRGASGLIDYWLLRAQAQRWSGVVHDHIVAIGGMTPAALSGLLGLASGGVAVGDSPSIWAASAPVVCDAVDQARVVFETQATLSSPTRPSWVAALLKISEAHPDVCVRLDVPSPPWVGPAPNANVIRRIRCLDMYREDRDGHLCIVCEPDGSHALRLEVPAKRSS
jgi:hypothetical protein